jgi:hypothetical protein
LLIIRRASWCYFFQLRFLLREKRKRKSFLSYAIRNLPKNDSFNLTSEINEVKQICSNKFLKKFRVHTQKKITWPGYLQNRFVFVIMAIWGGSLKQTRVRTFISDKDNEHTYLPSGYKNESFLMKHLTIFCSLNPSQQVCTFSHMRNLL